MLGRIRRLFGVSACALIILISASFMLDALPRKHCSDFYMKLKPNEDLGALYKEMEAHLKAERDKGNDPYIWYTPWWKVLQYDNTSCDLIDTTRLEYIKPVCLNWRDEDWSNIGVQKFIDTRYYQRIANCVNPVGKHLKKAVDEMNAEEKSFYELVSDRKEFLGKEMAPENILRIHVIPFATAKKTDKVYYSCSSLVAKIRQIMEREFLRELPKYIEPDYLDQLQPLVKPEISPEYVELIKKWTRAESLCTKAFAKLGEDVINRRKKESEKAKKKREQDR